MPDQNGTLTQQENNSASQHFNKVFKNATCPFCQSKNWTLLGHVINPPIMVPGIGLSVGGPSIPMVMLASDCGFIAHFSAVAVGVLPSSQMAGGAPGQPQTP